MDDEDRAQDQGHAGPEDHPGKPPAGPADLHKILGMDPTQIDELSAAEDLVHVQRPLSALIGTYPSDLVIRAATLYSLQNAGRAALDPQAKNDALWWMPEAKRDTALKNLQDGGWIEFTEDGWVFTQLGHDLYQLVELLFHLGQREDMTFGRVILRALQELSGDPLYALKGLLTQVRSMEFALEKARRSRSSVIMEGQLERCKQARAVVQTVINEVSSSMTDPDAIQIINDLHHANARMMAALLQLEEALAEVTKQHVILPEGFTPHQITESLMSMPLEALVDVASASIHPIHQARPLLREDLLTFAAESYLDRAKPPRPTRPEEIAVAAHNPEYRVETDPRVGSFIGALAELEGHEVPVIDILQGDPEEILMRLASLPFLDVSSTPDRGEKRLADVPWRYEPREGYDRPDIGPLRLVPRSVLRRTDETS